jgi:hypothetical protein
MASLLIRSLCRKGLGSKEGGGQGDVSAPSLVCETRCGQDALPGAGAGGRGLACWGAQSLPIIRSYDEAGSASKERSRG